MQHLLQTLTLNGNTAQPADGSRLELAVGLISTLGLTFVDGEGTPVDPLGAADAEQWKFILAGDWDRATDNCFATLDVTRTDVGQFTIDVDGSRTSVMMEYLGAEEWRQINAELVGIGASGDEGRPVSVTQWQMNVRNRVDNMGGAPTPESPYVTHEELEEEEAEYLQPILTGVTGIAGTVDNATHGNSALKAELDTLATSTQATGIQSTLDNQTNGLASIHATVKSKASQTSVNAIDTKVDSIESVVTNQTYGNSALKTRLDILYDGDYGLETLKGTADDAFTAANDCWMILDNATYGNSAIKAALTAVGQTASDTNTRAQSIYQYIDGVIYPLETNIKQQVNGLADGTHPVNIILGNIQSDGQATNTTVNAIDNVVSNGTYGNSAIKTALNTVDTNVTSVKATVEDNNDKLGDLATVLDIINGEVL